jgi:hypothetical protein
MKDHKTLILLLVLAFVAVNILVFFKIIIGIFLIIIGSILTVAVAILSILLNPVILTIILVLGLFWYLTD